VSVKVTGHVTDETVPGRKRHRLNPVVAALSRNGLPVVLDMATLITFPVTGSTIMTTTPSPVIFCRLAS
jgi:hypothetical protein